MDQHRDYRSSLSYDNSIPPPNYHDGSNFNHGGDGHYDHHRRYQNHHQDFGNEPTDSFGHANGTAFAGRKRQFSHSALGAPGYNDSNYAKLYVKGVPREASEQDIQSLFGKHGNIIEVVLFKQLKNVQEQDCCFVKYAKTEDAAQAIRSLHNQHIFPGGIRPIEVKYASTSKKQERIGLGGFRGNECKLFVASLNKHASEGEIAQIFSPYGCVEEVFLLRDEQKQNRGTGFITFTQKDMAIAAINALSGTFIMKGCEQPLLVRFADPKKPKSWDNRCGQTSLPNTSHMSSLASDPPECDWSEHICPDGNAYYYNSVTCESLWEKPEEYRSYYYEQDQQLDYCS